MKVNWVFALATTIVAALSGTATVVRGETYTLSDAKSQFVSHLNDDEADDECACEEDNGCDCEEEEAEEEEEPIRLFPELPGGFTLTGWVAGGGTANADDPVSNYNGTLTFNDRQEFQMNQLNAVLERVADTTCHSFAVGGRVDLMYGTDYIFTQALGLETERDGSPGWNNHIHYGLAMPQAYAELAYERLSVKIGHWYTPIGNEVVTAPQNQFYSHAYTMQYGEPFTHTGVLGTFKVNDQLTTMCGFHNGWDVFDRPDEERLSYIGGLLWTNEEGDVALASTITTGDELNVPGGFSNRSLYSLVGTFTVTEKLKYVIQHDNGWQEDFFAADVNAEWYGINQYLIYTMNDCWSAATRFEWFRDDDGVRVTGIRANNPAAFANAGPNAVGTAFVGNFYEATAGLNWTPNKNLKVRPEVRWDWYDQGVAGPLPFNDNTEASQFTAAIDAILLW